MLSASKLVLMITAVGARILTPCDVSAAREVLAVFAQAFEDEETYAGKPPSDEYLAGLLSDVTFVAIAGYSSGQIVGGLSGYVLRKLEQERTEFYIYDLTVLEAYRRQGVATAMIEKVKRIAAERSIFAIYVQADYGDGAAVALYTKLGRREDVMHFDLLPSPGVG